MHGVLLAAVIHPSNTPGGYQLTYLFPLLVFIISAAALFLRFRTPHKVPGHVALTSARWAKATAVQAKQEPRASQEPQATAEPSAEDGE